MVRGCVKGRCEGGRGEGGRRAGQRRQSVLQLPHVSHSCRGKLPTDATSKLEELPKSTQQIFAPFDSSPLPHPLANISDVIDND